MTLQELFQKYYDKTATDAERQELIAAISITDDRMLSELVTQAGEQLQQIDHQLPKQRVDEILSQILSGKGVIAPLAQEPAVVGSSDEPVHRVHFLRTAWFRYAAAIIITIGVGTYLYINNQTEKPSVTQTNPVPVQNDVAPGGNKAVLTLADGRTIRLEEAVDGVIAEEGTTNIQKKGDQVLYSLDNNEKHFPSLREGSGVGSNKVSTPRGGQYQISLPDGTKVWLNAASAITYPIAFTGKERNVSITGEAYFEVAKDKAKPFKVLVKQGSNNNNREKDFPSLREGSGVGSENEESKNLEIEVLGTHFNVNAYPDEQSITTTLIEGSVRLINKNSVHTSLRLKPGQQGQLNNEKLSLVVHPDVDAVIAWKNGLFNFNDADLRAVMRQIERWYNVTVEYENEHPEIVFTGKMYRNAQLSVVLDALKRMGVKLRLEGSKIIIL